MKNTDTRAVSLKVRTSDYGHAFKVTNSVLGDLLTEGTEIDQRTAGVGSALAALVAKVIDPKATGFGPVADKASDKLLADFMARSNEE